MKHSRFYISLYVIFPFIFTGFTIFAAIVSFRLTKYGLMHGIEPARPVFWFIIVISCLSYASGFLLVRIILKPVENFVGNGMLNFAGGLLGLFVIQQQDFDEKILERFVPPHNIFCQHLPLGG